MFGRLLLIPFLEERRSAHGLEAQQRDEIRSEEVSSSALSATGSLVGLSEGMEHLLKGSVPEVVTTMGRVQNLGNHCFII